MRRKLRVFAWLTIVLLVAAACSKPKTQQEAVEAKAKEGLSALEGVKEGAPGKVDGAAVSAAAVGAEGPAAQGYLALNPTADIEHAAKVAALIKPQSTDYPNGNPNTWAGVNKDTIKLVFSRDSSNCGVNLINAVSQAGGNFATDSRYYRRAPTDQATANKESEQAIKALVDYWNLHAYDVVADATQLTPILDKFNKPGHPFYGRKLVYEVVDGGSFQCREKTTAAAIKIADTIKPFGVVTDDVPGINGTGYNMSAALQAKAPASSRPVHFGVMDPSDKFLTQWAPYVWNQFQSGTKMAQMSASLYCARYVGRKAVNAPQMKDSVRKFALLYPNNPNARQVASEFKQFAKEACGKNIIDAESEFAYSEDPARAVDEGTQMAVKMRINGVTSVIYFNDLLGPLFHMVGFKQQGFRPEFVWTGTAYQAVSTVQRLYDQEMVDKASFGYSPFGIEGFSYGAGDPFWTWHSIHKKSPKGKACDPSSDAGMSHDPEYCKAPGAIATWYYSWLPLVGGMLFAGPNLTPKITTDGLQAYPLTRYGVNGPTDDPQAVLVGAGPGQHYFIVDGSEWRWRSGFVSPPVERKLGWVEFTDCQRHYMAWPGNLAVQWEQNGPNYGAYCGDAKYASSDYAKQMTGSASAYKPSEGACSDTPSGKCETDKYSRWLARR